MSPTVGPTSDGPAPPPALTAGDAPTIPPSYRTAVYVGAFVLDGLALVVFGILALLEVLDPMTATAASAIVFGATGFVTSGLGVAYRPTRPDVLPSGAPAP